jgi:hypothetical protein
VQNSQSKDPFQNKTRDDGGQTIKTGEDEESSFELVQSPEE